MSSAGRGRGGPSVPDGLRETGVPQRCSAGTGSAGPVPDTVPFGMIVLAGGRAVRLGGADKPGLMVGGRTLLAAVLAAGTGAGARPVIVVGPDRPGGPAGGGPAGGGLPGGGPAGGGPDRPGGPGSGEPAAPRVVREEPPGAGPLPALRRGLAELAALHGDTGDAGLVAVLAADLPFLRAAHLRALLAAAAGQDGAVLTDDDGRPQWLAGCWRAAVLHRAAGRYPGASLHGLLSPLNPVSVRIEPEPGEPPPWLDCDTEADVRRARDWVSGALAPVSN